MSVALRLARHGLKKRPFYRVVATPKGTKRDGRFLEIIGTFDPKSSPAKFTLLEDRIKYWIGVGAQPTKIVRNLINKQIPGFLDQLEKQRREKIRARRRKRKERAAKTAKKK